MSPLQCFIDITLPVTRKIELRHAIPVEGRLMG